MDTIAQRRLSLSCVMVQVIANCIRLSRAGLRQQNKPLGIFLFLGPTGYASPGLTHTFLTSCSSFVAASDG